MERIIKNGIVYCPLNGIDGEKMDICIKDGKIVESVSDNAEVIDASGKIVMPGGVEVHSHIAGAKVNVGRMMRPEDSKKDAEATNEAINRRAGSGFSVPSTFMTGYRYAQMGYSTAMEAAMPPLLARHTHEELEATPILDHAAFPLFGNNWFVMDYLGEGDIDSCMAYASWLLKATKGYAIKIVNPVGTEAWGWGGNVHGLHDTAPHFSVTPAEVIKGLAQVNEKLKLPHSIHLHCNDLGHPGNYETTLESFDLPKGIKVDPVTGSRDTVLHATHVQYHSYGGTSWRDFESAADIVADYVNKSNHMTIDVGQVTLDETTTMTADGPMEFDLHSLNGLKWANCDVEMETGSGVVPFIYSAKAPVPAVQWAIGMELFLLVKDAAKVCLTTDTPNAGPFTRYPRVMAWLMSNQYRTDLLENELHKWAQKRSSIATIDREYSLYEIAQVTRSTPAKVLGLSDTKGHLGVGADADISIYDLNPETMDLAAEYMTVEKKFQKASYLLKDGEFAVKDGEVVNTDLKGRTFWADTQIEPDLYKNVLADIEKQFVKYYSINFQNYAVEDSYISKSVPVKGVSL
ncbi:MAG: formylmethanofuran dehydrogenase subunit A [Methanobacteriaceae archaeon]|nr:formylmethanofuran dehydrogenase subunit A [Methanobacteriaceae archaeon]MDP2836580.1 formylmethanofuran dehydrogenase subunit A [Methanobacteriaceae archaeon]MDP3034410.1 formylmethanofuran dehydrogenase subunit A [Methanobacteriaceae archaeon]MDP3485557.1 formylmethanofuran dehydrogenase subunit A [Methanobacteriaceae archaeon]MDP3624005.1 formylmethanofuran dehydrogenase subunit A [Methanobacteriaceae archaeon]